MHLYYYATFLDKQGLKNNTIFSNYLKLSLIVDIREGGEMRMMQLNMLTLTQLTKRLLPFMLEGGRGKVLNVASTAAFQPGPLMAV